MNARVKRALLILVVAAFAGASIVAAVPSARARAWSAYTRLRGRQTVESVLAAVGPAARARLSSANATLDAAAGHTLLLVAFKKEKRLEVFTGPSAGPFRLLKSYPILAASGGAGPKTREGDRQVPEGVYRVSALNPNSSFHLALRLDYPNDEDIAVAKEEDRDPATLGGDIMIHGRTASIGCLAMGDQAIEELFVLAAEAGIERVRVLILPHDLRSEPASDPRPWVTARYERLRSLLPGR